MTATFECSALSKKFGPVKALDAINISIAPGRVVGLLGPNGSGKTTLIKLANGLLTPDGGSIRICGNEPGKESKALVSYLPDKMMLPAWMSVQRLMDMYEDFYADFDRARAVNMLGNLGLDERQKIGQMSKGTKEKVQLIMVMSRRAKLYLLDEPIGGVDPATRDYILNTIVKNYDENAVVMISTHLISDVENVLDEVIFIDKGTIRLQASVDDIREQYGKSVDALFREVFKCWAN